MFICHDCKRAIGPCKKGHLTILEKREVKYLEHETTGWEIVKEALICNSCHSDREQQEK